MIFYGNEVGMWGADDPHDTWPMIWKDKTPYEYGYPEKNIKLEKNMDCSFLEMKLMNYSML